MKSTLRALLFELVLRDEAVTRRAAFARRVRDAAANAVSTAGSDEMRSAAFEAVAASTGADDAAGDCTARVAPEETAARYVLRDNPATGAPVGGKTGRGDAAATTCIVALTSLLRAGRGDAPRGAQRIGHRRFERCGGGSADRGICFDVVATQRCPAYCFE